MTDRQFLALFLRIAGVWALIAGMAGLPTAVAAFLQLSGLNVWGPEATFPPHLVLTYFLHPFIYFAVAVALLVLARPLSSMLSDTTAPDEPPFETPINLAGLYRVGLQLLGFYALTKAVPWIARVIALSVELGLTREMFQSSIGERVQLGMYVLLGAVLIFGARVIADRLAHPRD